MFDVNTSVRLDVQSTTIGHTLVSDSVYNKADVALRSSEFEITLQGYEQVCTGTMEATIKASQVEGVGSISADSGGTSM